ncbi:Protein of unknown function (DUF2283) [Candidatus Fervidibacteria bacterium JGI MDM2 JNZ-1-D12]
MRLIYDPEVYALTIRLIEEQVECEVIQLNDQIALDFGPGDRLIAIEILDTSELIPDIKERGVLVENLPFAGE